MIKNKIIEDLNAYVKIPDREEPIFMEEYALASMLLDGVLVPCDVESATMDITGLFINCNDIFAPAADGEDLPYDKIEEFYKYWKKDHIYGYIQWVAKRRGYLPFKSIVDKMIEVGCWDEELEQIKKLHE